MKAIFNENYFQLIVISDEIRPDGQPYTFSTTCGTIEEAHKLAKKIFGIDKLD